jgi:hypothetical protein
MVARGRGNPARGERSPLNSVLTTAQAAVIKNRVRELPRVGASQRVSKGSYTAIAREYGTSPALIRDIAYGRCWAHVI